VLRFLIQENFGGFLLRTLVTGLVCVLVAGFSAAQSNSGPVLEPRNSKPVQDLPASGPDQKISPDAPVITIDGVCDKGTAAADCKTVVTRAEFEKMVNALMPNMPKQQQKGFASRYATALVLAQRAHDQGLDKTPELEVQLQLQRLQTLAQLGQQSLEKAAAQVSDADIAAYYKEHTNDFQLLSYDKIFVPRLKQADIASQNSTNPEQQKQREASEAAMKQEADKLRARAAAGEDFTKLQQEAYNFAGQNLKATSTRVDNVAKAHFPASDASVFDLKVGEVSPVLNDPQAYMIYKVEAKKDQPLEEVKPDITRALQMQKVQQARQDLQKTAVEKTKLDEAYFAGPAPPSLKEPGERAAPSAPATGTQPPGKK
jgi:PPIC-type PPIASE domain